MSTGKIDLYRFLLNLHKSGVEIQITTPWGEDGWQIRVKNYQSEYLVSICNSSRVHQGGDHYELNQADYVIILARTGMDDITQTHFDNAAMGRWVDA